MSFLAAALAAWWPTAVAGMGGPPLMDVNPLTQLTELTQPPTARGSVSSVSSVTHYRSKPTPDRRTPVTHTIRLDMNNCYTSERCALTGETFEADLLLAVLPGVGYVNRAVLYDPDVDPAALLRERAADLRARADELESIADDGIDVDLALPESFFEGINDPTEWLNAPVPGVTVTVPTTEEERTYGMGDERLALDPALAVIRGALTAEPQPSAS